MDQPAYDEILKTVDADLDVLRGVQRSIRAVDDYSERVRALKGKIDEMGAHLLDAETMSKVETLSRTVTLMQSKSLPLNDYETQLSEALNMLYRLEADVPVVMRRNQIRQKGLEYANRRETYWKSTSKRNEMTDKVDVYAESTQKNGQGAVAHITGSCHTDAISFSALIVDEGGKPTVDIPFLLFNAEGWIRINDKGPERYSIQLKGSFTNELKLISLYRAHTNLPTSLSDTWRLFVQFDTSMGQMLIKIPIYDTSVQQMIKSCS